jgi:hypothetical protein
MTPIASSGSVDVAADSGDAIPDARILPNPNRRLCSIAEEERACAEVADEVGKGVAQSRMP